MAPMFAQLQSFRFLLVGTLRTPSVCIQIQLKMQKHVTTFLVPVKLFLTAPGHLEVCDSP